ncbi:MAG: hypothetical protein AAGF26_09205 [Cyanobacteria bacterium P01_G01_bin.49]
MEFPIQSQPILRTTKTAKIDDAMLGVRPSRHSTWHCYAGSWYAGFVRLWWGHTTGDALWACNQWRKECQDWGCTHAKRSIIV